MLNQQTINKLGNLLCPEIPDIEIRQAINTRINQQTLNLRKHDPKNWFGSSWGEITAKMATERLGWRLEDFKRILKRKGNNIAKTEQNNAAIVLLAGMKERIRSNGLKIAKEERINNMVNGWINITKEFGCDDLQTNRAIECFEELLITQNVKGKLLNISTLLKLLSETSISNKPLVIDILRCPPQIDSKVEGIQVATETNFSVLTAEGKLARVDQKETLKGVKPILNVLNKHKINTEIKIVLIDIDWFVMDSKDLEEKITIFENNFRKVVTEILPGADIVRLTNLLGVSNLKCFLNLPEVKKIIKNPTDFVSERHFEKLVDDIFSRLKLRTLPDDLKTRENARTLAKRRLALEWTMGERLSQNIQAIFIQRSKTTAAGDTFLAGAKNVNHSPSMMFFWTNRVIEEI
jgi:hypothetical protein